MLLYVDDGKDGQLVAGISSDKINILTNCAAQIKKITIQENT
jgi:hypothetical protein